MERKIILTGILLFFLTFFISLDIGVYHVPFKDFLLTFLGKENGIYNTIIFQIRLPRIIMDALVGGGLACAGASYQALFKNPLVSPDILGVASGAAFGAALAILLNLNVYYIQIFSFFFGILSTLLTVFLAKKDGEIPILGLIISGMVVGTFFTALIGIIKYLADTQNQLPQIVFWLLGSFADVGWNDWIEMIIVLVSIIALFSIRWKLNVLSLSEDETKSLGINTSFYKFFIIFVTTILTSSSVSVVGIIGWIGLIAPHIARFSVGADNSKVIPVSVLFGSVFLIIADDLARASTSGEIPIGILTSLIGAPIFAFIYRKIYKVLR